MTGDEVRAAKFREKLRGYDPAQVDPLLEAVARELDAKRSPVDLIRRAQFRSKLRGYHPVDVDAFLAQVQKDYENRNLFEW